MKNNLIICLLILVNSSIFAQYKSLIIETDSIRIYDTNISKNTVNSLSPAFYKDGVLFASMVNKNEILFDSLKNPSRYKLYYSNLKSEIKPIKISSKFNLGKVAIYNNEIYFTGNNNIGNLTIYKGIIDEFKVKKVHQFSICENNFNYGHPSISKDGKTMVVVTNEKGIFHLLILKRNGDKWIKTERPYIIPRNFSLINPFLVNENIIYFSSNFKNGKVQSIYTNVVNGKPVIDEIVFEEGSFNIYKIERKNGSWGIPKNVNVFNSEFDDLDVLFINDKSGYLTTSRFDDNDNIFYFELKY